MSTVGFGLANEYEKNFQVKPIVITNAPSYQSITHRTAENGTIKLVHHGIFNISRQPELMLELMNLLDSRFTLDLIFMLPESASQQTKNYFEEYKIKATENTAIRILPGLKTNEIVDTLNKNYDLGLILIPPINFNYENGMPNKLFDFIQARIGLVLGPLKEMSLICNRFDLGVVSDDFTAETMARKLSVLTEEDVNRFKANTNVAVQELSADKNEQLFLDKISSIL